LIESIIEFSCRNKFLVIFAFVALTIAGIWTMRHTAVDAIPDLSENQVIVFTDWMGRSPQEIEDQITYPLSVNLQGLAGVKAIRSSSEFNFSMINIIFDDSIDFYFARTRVLERLALANTYLPQGVTPYLAPDATALGQIFWYTVEGENQDPDRLRAIQDYLVRYQLNSVPGVAQVASVGGFPREYQVDVTPESLRAFNVTLGQIYSALERGNSAVGGRVIQKGNAEYLIRGVGWIKSLDDIRNTVIVAREGVPIRVGDVATVQLGTEFRRSVLEKNGREVTGGVVMMRYGENPLIVTKRVKEAIRNLQKGLPEGVRIVPFYDRTRLIEGAVETVRRILEHEIIIAAIAILLILTHFTSVLVVIITLPLSILFSFILMRYFGISSNIMSLSGIAISIGILVDQSIVMLENATHRLGQHFGEERIHGDTTDIVAGACRQVGRPIFFSVVIMVISFLPVFALTGQEGKLFHPLAFTKTFALIGTAIISITLVPALIPLLVRGRIKREDRNWIVRSVMDIYRPTLRFLLHRPKTVLWLFALLLGFGFFLARHIGREFMPPLNEGSILDMPVTVPRASVTEVADDLKARDALIRSFPEVEMIVGKAGRADTPTDPSPLDMVESIITLRPHEHWLKRKMHAADAEKEALSVIRELERDGAIKPFASDQARRQFAQTVSMSALDEFDAMMRQTVLKRQMSNEDTLSRNSVAFLLRRLFEQIDRRQGWSKSLQPVERGEFIKKFMDSSSEFRSPGLDTVERLIARALQTLANDHRLALPASQILAISGSPFIASIGSVFGAETQDWQQKAYLALEDFRDKQTRDWVKKTDQEIFNPAILSFEQALIASIKNEAKMQDILQGNKIDGFDPVKRADQFKNNVFLWPADRASLQSELDRRVRMVGWANIWTQPIINRVDMLATGVRTQLAVKVYGNSQEQIQEVSNKVADVLRGVPGAVDVVADQTVGKGYVEIEIDRARAARYGISVGDIQDIIEVALGGKPITLTIEGRERFPVRLRYARAFRLDEQSIRNILVSSGGMSQAPSGSAGMTQQPAVYLSDVANIKVVEGPVMIKSENGMLRSYVQLNVRDRDIVGFVEEAQRVVAEKVPLPANVFFEWTGQFEHQVRARNTLRIVFPAVLLLIFIILYMTYKDIWHAMLMMMAVPGALAGGVIFQWLFGYNFSVAVWVGYIACFGMATETGIIMLVYLRDAIAERGGLQAIGSLEELEQAVMAGAVHRLRPKLLTEGTAIVGLAPMLWARGVGAEVVAPMAAPVLGGLLIADEVIDIFLPVLFYHLEARRWRKLHNHAEAVEPGLMEGMTNV